MAKIEERVLARFVGAGDVQGDAREILSILKRNFNEIEVEAKPSSRDVILMVRIGRGLFNPKVVEFAKALGVRDVKDLSG